MDSQTRDDRHSGSRNCSTAPLPILTFDFQCFGCGRPLRIPIRPEWDNPVYVMEMERQHRLMREEITELRTALIELAGECVDAGVKPSILQRADEMKEKLRVMLKWFDDHQQ